MRSGPFVCHSFYLSLCKLQDYCHSNRLSSVKLAVMIRPTIRKNYVFRMTFPPSDVSVRGGGDFPIGILPSLATLKFIDYNVAMTFILIIIIIIIPFGTENYRVVWVPEGEKSLMTCFSCFDRIPACDRQTDGQTSCNSIVRAMHSVAR